MTADVIEKAELDIMDVLQKAHNDGVSWKKIWWLVRTIILPNLAMKVIAERELKGV